MKPLCAFTLIFFGAAGLCMAADPTTMPVLRLESALSGGQEPIDISSVLPVFTGLGSNISSTIRDEEAARLYVEIGYMVTGGTISGVMIQCSDTYNSRAAVRSAMNTVEKVGPCVFAWDYRNDELSQEYREHLRNTHSDLLVFYAPTAEVIDAGNGNLLGVNIYRDYGNDREPYGFSVYMPFSPYILHGGEAEKRFKAEVKIDPNPKPLEKLNLCGMSLQFGVGAAAAEKALRPDGAYVQVYVESPITVQLSQTLKGECRWAVLTMHEGRCISADLAFAKKHQDPNDWKKLVALCDRKPTRLTLEEARFAKAPMYSVDWHRGSGHYEYSHERDDSVTLALEADDGKAAAGEKVRDMTHAIALAPKKYDYRIVRARAYSEREEWTKAKEDCDVVIELRPNEPLGYILRGSALARLRDYDKAMADYAKAIELDPASGMAFRRRAECLLRMGQLHKAMADANKAIELLPDNPPGFLTRAEIYVLRKEYDKANADLVRYVELEGDSNAELRRVVALIPAAAWPK